MTTLVVAAFVSNAGVDAVRGVSHQLELGMLANLKSYSSFRILRKVIGDRVPRRAIIDKSMKLRPNSWIIIERAHANRHLRSVRPITAEQTGAAVDTERLNRALALSVNLDQLFALQQAELFPPHTCLRAYSSPGMFAAAITMAMAGLKERRINFKAHAAAQTTPVNALAHLRLSTISFQLST
jgi:hypothetical protein